MSLVCELFRQLCWILLGVCRDHVLKHTVESWHLRNLFGIEPSLLSLIGLGPRKFQLILSRDRSDYRRALDWQLVLPNTYRSYLQVTITLYLFHTFCSSLQHVLNLLSPVSSSADVPLLLDSRPLKLAAIPHQPPTLLCRLKTPSRYIASARTAQKTRFQQLLHCCVLHSRYLAVVVSLAPQFLLWHNIYTYTFDIDWKPCVLFERMWNSLYEITSTDACLESAVLYTSLFLLKAL
jgi:hypothetical protein